MKNRNFIKITGCVTASVALGILIQIFLPDILIVAVCCLFLIIMGFWIAKCN